VVKVVPDLAFVDPVLEFVEVEVTAEAGAVAFAAVV
jgi:hypothetical protein